MEAGEGGQRNMRWWERGGALVMEVTLLTHSHYHGTIPIN